WCSSGGVLAGALCLAAVLVRRLAGPGRLPRAALLFLTAVFAACAPALFWMGMSLSFVPESRMTWAESASGPVILVCSLLALVLGLLSFVLLVAATAANLARGAREPPWKGSARPPPLA